MPRPTPSDAAQGVHVQGSSQVAARSGGEGGGGGRGDALAGEPLLAAADGAPAGAALGWFRGA